MPNVILCHGSTATSQGQGLATRGSLQEAVPGPVQLAESRLYANFAVCSLPAADWAGAAALSTLTPVFRQRAGASRPHPLT